VVSRAEFVFYGIFSMFSFTIYRFFIEGSLMAQLPNAGFTEALLANGAVWFLSAFIAFILIRQIKRVRGVQ
jgi:hypothetical protein